MGTLGCFEGEMESQTIRVSKATRDILMSREPCDPPSLEPASGEESAHDRPFF
jgi:hypothetical protein